MEIFDWPLDWYEFTDSTFYVQARSLKSSSTTTPRRNVHPTFQAFVGDFTLRQKVGPSKWQKHEAFIARLRGDAGLIRIGDPLKCYPLAVRGKLDGKGEPWSDGTYFTDQTGWRDDGIVPPSCEVMEFAPNGSNYIKIKGLPPSTVAYHEGDLIELRVNGMPGETCNLHEIVTVGPTDALGRTGVEIVPPLRQGFAEGDMVINWHPRGVFRLIDSGQGILQRRANVGGMGFTVEEHAP